MQGEVVNMGRFYKKNIQEVEFYGIKYRCITRVSEYTILEKEVTNLIDCSEVCQLKIDIENKIEEAKYERDASMGINLPIVIFWIGLFIGSYITGYMSVLVRTENVGIPSALAEAGIGLVIMCYLVVKGRDIHKYRCDKIIFFETIKKIIEHQKQI